LQQLLHQRNLELYGHALHHDDHRQSTDVFGSEFDIHGIANPDILEHNGNIRNDNIRNDNIRNDNIRNDNIRNDNLRNDNIRNGNGKSDVRCREQQ
jgi:hypothetical protein